MEKFKNASQKLYAKRPLFFNIGLFVAISLCFIAFEHKVHINGDDVIPLDPFEDTFIVEDIKPTVHKPKPRPQLPNKKATVINITDEPRVEQSPEKEETKLELDDLDDLLDGDAPSIEIVEDPTIHIHVEKSPQFKGGIDAFYKFVADNLEYPRKEQRMGIDGRVYLQFVIERDGSLTDIKVLKGVSEGLDAEAKRVLEAAPSWIPGSNRGQAVRVRMTLPIVFQLQ